MDILSVAASINIVFGMILIAVDAVFVGIMSRIMHGTNSISK